jgi:RimJ/RimL family protein N-acetyltransferase
MMKVTIRPFEDHDIPSMASIRAQEWATEAFWQERIREYLRKEHSPRQALSARAAFVAVQEGKVVGFVAGHRTRRYGCEGELQWINVVKAKHGCGAAGELLSKMSAWFVEQKALRICVDVDPKNAAARNLYAKYGARPLHQHWIGKTSLP